MKKTLQQIERTIQKVADKKSSDAGYAGDMGDRGSSKLLSDLEMFISKKFRIFVY